MKKNETKKFDLMFTHRGNGIGVCDRTKEEHGDYKPVAHIYPDRTINYYYNACKEIKNEVFEFSIYEDPSVSVSQPDQKVFNTRPPVFKVGKTYHENITMKDRRYPAKCIARSKCFATFEILGSIIKKKIFINPGCEAVYTAGSVIYSRDIITA